MKEYGVDLIYLTQTRGQWRALVNTVTGPPGSIQCDKCLDQVNDY
jgi:hypothetical protein